MVQDGPRKWAIRPMRRAPSAQYRPAMPARPLQEDQPRLASQSSGDQHGGGPVEPHLPHLPHLPHVPHVPHVPPAVHARAIAALPIAVLYIRGDGKLIWANPDAQSLLRDARSGTVIVGTMSAALRRAAAHVCALPAARWDGRMRSCEVVQTWRGAVHIRGICLSDEPRAAERLCALVIETDSAVRDALTDSALRDRFRLTPRQIEVARLVAVGRSTREVARTLGISEHTVRHHIERVLRRFGVRSRSAVAAVIAGC